jgi:hypothetical protein
LGQLYARSIVSPIEAPKRSEVLWTPAGEERQRNKGMALTFIPSDLIERAARDENWTDSDRHRCSRMLTQAFEESFQAKEIQRSVNGLIAYDSPFVSLAIFSMPAPVRPSPAIDHPPRYGMADDARPS